MNLRPHQSRALEAMNGANKGKILIPTGGGKTLIAINHCRETLSQSTRNRVAVVVAPRILLATQLSEEFITGLNGLEYAVVMYTAVKLIIGRVLMLIKLQHLLSSRIH